MIVVLNDWPFGPQVVDSWVREQLTSLGLDPDGVDSVQLWSCALVRTDSERTAEIEHESHVGSDETHLHEMREWLVEYHPLEAVVEHTDPQFGVHTTLHSCPWCSRLTDRGVCPSCGEDIINTPVEAVFQTAEEMENWFGYDSPGTTVQFRCEYCDQFFGVEGAIRHAQQTHHTQFHRA
jgi:hypothetical protein